MQVGFSSCWVKFRFSSCLQGLMVGDLALTISVEGGRLRLPPGPQLMMHSHLVPGNMQQSDGPVNYWHDIHTSVVTVSSGSEPSNRTGTCIAGTVPNTQKQTVCQAQSYLSPMGPRGPSGVHPSQRGGFKIKFPHSYLMIHSPRSFIPWFPEHLLWTRHYKM